MVYPNGNAARGAEFDSRVRAHKPTQAKETAMTIVEFIAGILYEAAIWNGEGVTSRYGNARMFLRCINTGDYDQAARYNRS